jgi:hypothetical protein
MLARPVHLFKLRELVDTGVIDIQPINTDDNIANILTKRRVVGNTHRQRAAAQTLRALRLAAWREREEAYQLF